MAAKAAVAGVVGKFTPVSEIFLNVFRKNIQWVPKRRLSGKPSFPGTEFGLFFDIDGVIVRGRELLPTAKEAFQLLIRDNKFWVPTIFVTNAGNVLRQKKAGQLSEWLDVEVQFDQVVMSHSPLKMFRQFLNKHVLVSGQGPVMDIAKNLGFTKVTTMETVRQCFPMLDMVDHHRRKSAPCGFEKYFPRIEAVIMFGEPVRWETNLQLIIDVLLTNGCPSHAPKTIPYPHIPVLACNMDFLWMSEACMPRFAHGCFLHCLESLYKKISGCDLKYTALVGKPSELTYYHSENVLQDQAKELGLPGLHRMYCIGDNPDVDIYGANLFHRSLQKRRAKHRAKQAKQRQQAKGRSVDVNYEVEVEDEENGDSSDDSVSEDEYIGLESCESVLVYTGVYCGKRDYYAKSEKDGVLLDYNHRDFIMDADLRKPTITAQNVLESVQAIFAKEVSKFHTFNHLTWLSSGG